MSRVLALGALAVLAHAAGCTNFDREDRIEDIRVLAIKTEPPEILYSPLHLIAPATRPPLPLAPIDVSVEVFAYDPRGGRTSTSVQLCPAGAGDSTCRLYDQEPDLLFEPAANRPELRELLEPKKFEAVIGDDAPAGRIAPFEGGTTFDWTFSPAVIDFFIPDSSDGTPVPSIFPLLPRVVVVAENLGFDAPDVEKERAFKRIPVALDLTSPNLPPDVVGDLAAGLGITLCTSPIPDSVWDQQGRADCLEARTANKNPILAGFHADETPEAVDLNEGTLTPDDLSLDLPLEITNGVAAPILIEAAAPGDILNLTPLFRGDVEAPNSVERYQVISFDIEASSVIILNRVEDLALNWYSTRGEVSSTLTAEQFGSSLGVSWVLPEEAVAGESDTLVVVVLDQRGGTAVGEITVRY